MTRAIIHVDMDAFYASVEQRDDPALRGKPVIVGGHARRGVVLAASYEVRKYGVRSAMPMARALKLAPTALVVPPRFEAYTEASERIHDIFESVTPLIEPLSLDEAFLDVTASKSLLGSAAVIAQRVRQRIRDELGLPASAGIASVKFVAKIASDLAKPNGQKEVAHDEMVSFLATLPIGRLWGVGPKTEQSMRAIGLNTLGDVAAREPAWLVQELGSAGQHFWELSQGLDDRPVVPDRDAKSIGAEDTFEHDLGDQLTLSKHIHSQALRVGRRMRKAHVRGRIVVLKIKYADFKIITRRTTLPSPSDDGQLLYRAAMSLLESAPRDRRVRLTGVSAQGLIRGEGQLGLFDSGANRAQKLNATLDQIALKFGRQAVLPADIAESESAHAMDDDARSLVGAARYDGRKT